MPYNEPDNAFLGYWFSKHFIGHRTDAQNVEREAYAEEQEAESVSCGRQWHEQPQPHLHDLLTMSEWLLELSGQMVRADSRIDPARAEALDRIHNDVRGVRDEIFDLLHAGPRPGPLADKAPPAPPRKR